jgi:glycine cleavage system transcriptional repressor
MEKPYYVITTVGRDASGLVAAMCQAITAARGNIEDSTMTRLGGQFAMMYLVCFEDSEGPTEIQPLCDALLQSHGLHVRLVALNAHEIQAQLNPVPHAPELRKYLLSVGGYDRTGITLAFSQALAELGVNITDVNAHRIQGEQGLVYMLAIEMECPATVSEPVLSERLSQLGQSMALDVRLRSMDAMIL